MKSPRASVGGAIALAIGVGFPRDRGRYERLSRAPVIVMLRGG